MNTDERILDGSRFAAEIRDEVAAEVAAAVDKVGIEMARVVRLALDEKESRCSGRAQLPRSRG